MSKIVFISHASADRAAAERIRDDLESDGLDCWMAPRDVPAGDDYAKAITDAIGSCQILLLLVSVAAARSDHIEREVHLADSMKLAIVPMRLEPLDPTGSLRYFLSNVQWIDAFPRIEPQLTLLRTEIRRLLAARGTPILPSAPSRFQHVLATAGAWTIIIGFEGLLLEWIHRVFLNLVPLWRVPIEALRSPALMIFLATPVLLAMALQYSAHRNVSRVARMDALFALSTRGNARTRLGVAAVLYGGAVVAIVLAPPAVRVQLAGGKIDAGSDYVQVRSCSSSPSYTAQTETHYRVELRVGSQNPPGTYAVRAELAPYATQDGIEFCEIWLDRRIGVTTTPLMSDDERSSAYVDVEGPLERFAGRRSVLFNVRHYRDSKPSARTAVTASVARGSVQRNDDEPITLPLR